MGLTGCDVSTATISRFLNWSCPFKGSLCNGNIVPIDKFRPDNFLRATEYLDAISRISPYRLKFGDEKLLKGAEVYCRKNRRNPLNGVVPPIVTNSDFRNTYTLLGLAGIDRRGGSAFFHKIHDNKNDAHEFGIFIEAALEAGFLMNWDVLVIDNARYHDGGDNKYLAEWLWDDYRILVLFLPTRTPEWNPVENVWAVLVRRLKIFPLSVLKRVQAHAVAFAAHHILNHIDFEMVERFYRKCSLIV